ncbi:MAG: WD40 repeat domain-containing protein [Planctomycetaceae bacterium]|nr:WD40 repeat domain-containing protein [Planctomycetaceae bacterium]
MTDKDTPKATEAVTPAAAEPAVIDPTKTHKVVEYKHERPLTTCQIDPQGRYVFAGAEDLNVCRWDLKSGKKTVLPGHRSWVRSIRFSPDGEWCFTAAWDGQIGWWKTAEETPQSVRMIEAHHGSTRWVDVSPCGQFLATCGNDKLVRVWNVADGKQVGEFSGHQTHPYAVNFHPHEKQLVSQDLMGNIKIWDLVGGKEVCTIEAPIMTGYDTKFAADMGGARDMQFTPDGKILASAGITRVVNSFAGQQDPLILLIDWQTRQIIRQLRTGSFQGIAWGVRFHPDGFVIGAGAHQGGRGELWFWHMPDQEPPKEEQVAKEEKDDKKPAPKPADSKKGENPELDRQPFHVTKLDKGARSVDISPDLSQLAVAHTDGFARIYQMTQEIEKKPAPATDPEKSKS